jgi:hypothetical protein
MFLLAFTGSVLSGCAASVPPIVYEPTATDSVYSFYQNGYALGTVGNDSCRVVAELEASQVAGDNYIRLWLLYYNSSNSPFLLDPIKAARIVAISRSKDLNTGQDEVDTLEFEATPPYEILGSIDNQKTIAIITQAINGATEALQTKPTTITNIQTGEQYQVNDSKEKSAKAINETRASIVNTSLIYDLYKQSIVAGILRLNTVFPQQSVTGYIYFKFPEEKLVVHNADGSYYVGDIEHSNCVLHLEIFTQNGKANFDFKPVAGE